MGGASAEHAAPHQTLLGELDGDRESIVGGMDRHQPHDPENGEKKGGTRNGELRRDVDTEHQPVRACSAPVRAMSIAPWSRPGNERADLVRDLSPGASPSPAARTPCRAWHRGRGW